MLDINTPAPEGNQDPRWIMAVRDLPQDRNTVLFTIDNDRTTLIGKRLRQVLEALQKGPIFCASPVRLSDAVLILRRDYGVRIETQTTQDGRKFYSLKSTVALTIRRAA